MKVLITGKPGCGKTTLCEKVVDAIKAAGRPVGGMVSKEMREGRGRVGFKVIDVATGREGILAHTEGKGPRLGKYRVNLHDLEDVGVGAMERAIDEGIFLVIDEIGPMELCSRRFIEIVERAFEADLDILATIHYRSRHPLVERLKGERENELMVMDEGNRDRFLACIFERLGLRNSINNRKI
ncbi:MAG: NTPase [Euryarchaeota archaeon]|nr:NTPase [Euryarchaeota archaeon]